ncbi:MAG: hypothetical protein IH851_09700 [Armatimonadetes bacterium]|nr:hypothetical protein [Armatimonadota bacterium]
MERRRQKEDITEGMYFKALGSNVDTVVVLGAGASRGDRMFEASAAPSPPPVDADFLQHIHLQGPTVSNVTAGLLAIAASEFGHIRGVGLEELLTRIESRLWFASKRHYAGLHSDPSSASSTFRAEDEQRLRDAREVAVSVLANSLRPWADIGGEFLAQSDHRDLVLALAPRDCIITFNYDTIVDRVLHDYRNNLWAPHLHMYLGQVPSVPRFWANTSPERPESDEGYDFRLLKMHGSVHFERELAPDAPELGSDSHWPGVILSDGPVANEPVIVPPLLNKRLEASALFSGIWSCAHNYLLDAQAILIVGYSAPTTDFLARALLSARRKDAKQIHIVAIVNSNRQHADTALNLIPKDRFHLATRIAVFDRFSDLHSMTTPFDEAPIK